MGDKLTFEETKAITVMTRREFCQELRSCQSISDLADVMIRILQFERGVGWDR